jgi:hypothetical protein
VPFFIDVFIGESMCWTGNRTEFMAELDKRIRALADEGHFAPWA